MKNRNWSEVMFEFYKSLPPSNARAQAVNIYHKLKSLHGETIAEMMVNDHRSLDGALRACMLLVEAGLAQHEKTHKYYYGKITFVDGSYIDSRNESTGQD